MALVDDDDVVKRLATLADEVSDAGKLRSPQWRQAFLAVRRHVFVPRFWHDEESGTFPARWRMVDGATRDHLEWLDAVYSDRTLATDLTAAPGDEGWMHPQVTSSTTMPGLMLAMLEDLDVTDGMRILEIGTGAGYTAALLCERLGDTHVTTIDIDPELVALATLRLADHGYRPTVVCGDGAQGVPSAAPFDRIIATCGIDHIPPAWIDQCRDGAKILANLRGPFDAWPLVLLTVENGTASGTFLSRSGAFMPRRTDPTEPFDYRTTIHTRRVEPARTHSLLDPALASSHRGWGQLAQQHLRGMTCQQVYAPDSEGLITQIATPDGSSWAFAHHTADRNQGHLVEQEGPRRLWDKLETLHEQWTLLGSPSLERFGLTINRGSPPVLWLDHPDSGHLWPSDEPQVVEAPTK